jgi:hypothetical protein
MSCKSSCQFSFVYPKENKNFDLSVFSLTTNRYSVISRQEYQVVQFLFSLLKIRFYTENLSELRNMKKRF